jgi:hypothetical protein
VATAAQRRQQEAQRAAAAAAAAQRLRNQNATLAAGHSPFRPFKPYQPPPLPTGTYDPALDAQRAAAARGYGDLQQDTALAGTRAAEDYGFTVNQYNQQVAALTKHYQDLGTAQDERANAYGVVPGGGALLQSAAKRQANQATDKIPLDTALGQATDAYQRGVTDRSNVLTRGGRENTFYGLDVGSEKAYQAGQAGYSAPLPGEPGGMPRNESVTAAGQHLRTAVVGVYRYTYGPTGKIVSKKRVR